MVALQAAPTDALSPPLLAHIRDLLDTAFDGDFTEEDWAHALGGIHVWLADSRGLISHGSLVERTLVCSGRSVLVGYVEAIATDPARQRRGYGTMVMEWIDGLVRERYALGALSTGAHGFYEALGWERWRGPTFVDGPAGCQRTPDDDGGVMIRRTAASPPLELDGAIVCDWRPGAVW